MTLRGKKKALNNNPEAQIAAIAEAFGGKVPVKPLPRRYPRVAWKEEDMYHFAKLLKGKLYHTTSKILSGSTINVYRDALSACSYLAQTYYRAISLSDIKAARTKAVPVPTLAEAQQAIICWIQNREQTKTSTLPTWQYCIVSPDGIKSGTTTGKPKPMDGYAGPLITVFSIRFCLHLLRHGFQLNLQGGELTEAFKKVVKVPKIIVIKENQKNSGE